MYCNRYALSFRSNFFQVHPTKIDAVNYLLTKHLFETFICDPLCLLSFAIEARLPKVYRNHFFFC